MARPSSATPASRHSSAPWIALALLATLLVPLPPAAAVDAAGTMGTDFWVAFPANESGASNLDLFLAGDAPGSGVVEIPGLGFSEAFSVTPGAVTTVDLPREAEVLTTDGVEAKGVHVTADVPVTVYGLDQAPATTDAYVALPVPALGTDYLVMSFPSSADIAPSLVSQLDVVGTVDGTRAMVTTRDTPGALPVTREIALQRGEVYQLQLRDPVRGDLTGTEVSATHPVAVFGGHRCAFVPTAEDRFCDMLVEQMPPVDAWGTEFLTAPLATREGGDTFRILAAVDGTTVTVDGEQVAALDRGGVHQQRIGTFSRITASQPVLVAQFSNSSSVDGVTSDPFMMLVPPFEQYLSSYTVSTPAFGISTNFVNLIAPDSALGAVRLDGQSLPASAWTPIPGSGFSGTQQAVAVGTHTVEAPAALGVFVYGFDSFDSYGYPGGYGTALIATATSLQMTPEGAAAVVGQEQCLSARLTDGGGGPVVGARVDFAVAGPNAGSGLAFTDADGRATFCYVGATAGRDTVRATSSGLEDTSTVDWSPPAQNEAPPPAPPPAPPQSGGEPTVGTAQVPAPRTITIDDVTVEEGDAGFVNASVTVRISRPYNEGQDLGVNLRFSGTGQSELVTGGSDSSFAQTAFADLVIKGGETSEDVTVQILNDTDPEPNETIVVEVVSTTDPTLRVEGASGRIIIVDNDDPLPITALTPTSVSDMCLVDTKGVGLRPEGLPEPAVLADQVLSCGPDVERHRMLVSRADDFADALASGPLQNDAPLMLVPGDVPLPTTLVDRLRDERPERIIVLGGRQAISDAVVAAIEALGISVERREGPTRIETAVDVAETDVPEATTAVIARAFPAAGGEPTQAFADAIAAGAWAAEERWPVLLTEGSALSEATRAYLQRSQVRDVMVMGGTAAVSDEVMEEIRRIVPGTVTRVGAPSRFGTAVQVAHARTEPGEQQDGVIMVEGTSEDAWMGGLTSAYLSAQTGDPVLLTAGAGLPEETAAYLGGSDLSFAQAVTAPHRIVCVAQNTACLRGRSLLRLPGASVVFSPPSLSSVVPGQPLSAAVSTNVPPESVTYGGSCLMAPSTSPTGLTVREDGPVHPCTFVVTTRFASGVVQTDTAAYTG